jgi:hypothetical protein
VVSISVNNSPNSVNRAKGFATNLANGLSSAPSGSSSHHALSSNVVSVSDLAMLTAEISEAQARVPFGEQLFRISRANDRCPDESGVTFQQSYNWTRFQG